jgi:hypothetical protein
VCVFFMVLSWCSKGVFFAILTWCSLCVLYGAQVVCFLWYSPSAFYEQKTLLLMLFGHSPNASHKLKTLLFLFGHSLTTI